MRTLKILFAFAFLIVSLAACDGRKIDTTPGTGDGWETVKHDTHINDIIVMPDKRPAHHLTPKGAHVYWNGEVSPLELQLVDNGITQMLGLCNRPQKNWTDTRTKLPIDVGAWKYYKRHSDYHVLLVEANRRSEDPSTDDCPAMAVGRGGWIKACGTNSGVRYVDDVVSAPGGLYIIVPKLDRDNPNCASMWETCIRNEAMHVFFMNDTVVFRANANDAYVGDHEEYCTGME
jgi:hypothetical protein